MGYDATKLSDEDFLYSHLAEFLDDELNPDLQGRIKGLLEKESQLSSDYGIARGRLQIAMQKYSLNENQLHNIHTLVEDDASRANHEAHSIEDVGRSEFVGRLLRGGFMASLVLTLFGFLYWEFAPERQQEFEPLETLVYEALAFEEDGSRIEFPTDNHGELLEYFERYPALGFTVPKLQEIGNGWEVTGGTVIDYEVAKILASKYTNPRLDENLYLFFFEGGVSDFPKSDPGNQKGLLYQAYATSDMNIVAWEHSENVLGMIIGRGGAEDLAQLAKTTSGI